MLTTLWSLRGVITTFGSLRDVCFCYLIAMVMLGWSVHLTTLNKRFTSTMYLVHILSLVTDNNPSWMNLRKGAEWPLKLFHDQSPRKYGTATPGSAVRHASVDTLPIELRGPASYLLTGCDDKVVKLMGMICLRRCDDQVVKLTGVW